MRAHTKINYWRKQTDKACSKAWMSISNAHCKPEKSNRQLSTLRYTQMKLLNSRINKKSQVPQGKLTGHLPKRKKGLSLLSTTGHYKTIKWGLQRIERQRCDPRIWEPAKLLNIRNSNRVTFVSMQENPNDAVTWSTKRWKHQLSNVEPLSERAGSEHWVQT